VKILEFCYVSELVFNLKRNGQDQSNREKTEVSSSLDFFNIHQDPTLSSSDQAPHKKRKISSPSEEKSVKVDVNEKTSTKKLLSSKKQKHQNAISTVKTNSINKVEDEDGEITIMKQTIGLDTEESGEPEEPEEPKDAISKAKEEMNALRNRNQIKVWGGDIPDPIASFDQLKERFAMKKYIL